MIASTPMTRPLEAGGEWLLGASCTSLVSSAESAFGHITTPTMGRRSGNVLRAMQEGFGTLTRSTGKFEFYLLGI